LDEYRKADGDDDPQVKVEDSYETFRQQKASVLLRDIMPWMLLVFEHDGDGAHQINQGSDETNVKIVNVHGIALLAKYHVYCLQKAGDINHYYCLIPC